MALKSCGQGIRHQTLLNEENLTLKAAKKNTTWEMAGANRRTLGVPTVGQAMNKLLTTYAIANRETEQVASIPGSVKIRLGTKPYSRNYQANNFPISYRRIAESFRHGNEKKKTRKKNNLIIQAMHVTFAMPKGISEENGLG